MEALAKISQKYNLVLVEDAAQALGSKYKNRSAGSLGDMAAFSFHETKNLICGEGGRTDDYAAGPNRKSRDNSRKRY